MNANDSAREPGEAATDESASSGGAESPEEGAAAEEAAKDAVVDGETQD